MGWRTTFRKVQESPWQTPDASFQQSRVGEEWSWGHGEDWRNHRVPNANDWGQRFDFGPRGSSLQPSYPHWGQHRDWQFDGAAANASWNLAPQQQYQYNLPNDYIQQSSSYSSPTAAGYWQKPPYHNNWKKLPYHNNSANDSILNTSDRLDTPPAGYWHNLPYHENSANASMSSLSDRLDDRGMIRSESRSQFQSRCLAFEKEGGEAKVSKEDRVGNLEKNTVSNRHALLEERNPTRRSKTPHKDSSSGAVVSKKKKKKKSKNKVKRLQDTQPKKNEEKSQVSKKDKSKNIKVQDVSVKSKLDRNKIFQSLKAAGESVKETLKGQVDKVKNLLKPKSKNTVPKRVPILGPVL